MVDNLRIGDEKLVDRTLTSELSNLTDSFTLPTSSISSFTGDWSQGFDNNALYTDESRGGYYAFYTATAGTGGSKLLLGNAPSSICPKNWHLPTSGSTSAEFALLARAYGNGKDNATSQALQAQPVPNFGMVGYYWIQQFFRLSDVGGYWSSTSYNESTAYDLLVWLTYVSPDTYTDGKASGRPLRCVFTN